MTIPHGEGRTEVWTRTTPCDDPLEHGAGCRKGRIPGRTRSPGEAVPDVLVSALCLRAALGPSACRRPGPDPGVLRPASGEAVPPGCRPRAGPVPLVPPVLLQA